VNGERVAENEESGLGGGVAALHKGRSVLQALIAPATDGEFNTLRPPLVPIACWRLEHVRFDFDSSFIKPEARGELAGLGALWNRIGQPPLSVFGHADPVGDDDYNKKLSGRRAVAVYAMLTRKPELWEELYSNPYKGDTWSLRSIQSMLAALGKDPGPASGASAAATTAAVRAYQTDKKGALAVDGIAGPETRRALFLDYMDLVCADASGAPLVFTESNFLARGQDKGGKGDYQGCSEFNPLIVFSKAEDAAYKKAKDHTARDAANQPNRRVLVFMFPPNTAIPPALWPCPRAGEGVADCKKHFWPDGNLRRSPQEAHREFELKGDTFACAFYDQMARLSPCEVLRRQITLRLFGPDKEPVPNAPYHLTVLATREERTGTADANGMLDEPEVVAPSRIRVSYGDPRLGDDPVVLGYVLDVLHNLGDEHEVDEAGARRRLNNLGYARARFFADAVRSFQKDYDLPETGELDEETKARLVAAADRGKSKADIAAGDLG
jgi:hypothetical protein